MIRKVTGMVDVTGGETLGCNARRQPIMCSGDAKERLRKADIDAVRRDEAREKFCGPNEPLGDCSRALGWHVCNPWTLKHPTN